MEQIEGLGLADYPPHNGRSLSDDLAHLASILWAGLLGEAGFVIGVVTKARLYSGPYRYLRFREKLFYRLGHHVAVLWRRISIPSGESMCMGVSSPSLMGAAEIVRLTVHHDRDDPAVELVQPLEKICKGAAFFRNSVFLILKSYNQS